MCGLDRYLPGFVGVGLKRDSEVLRRELGKERRSVQSTEAEIDEKVRNTEAWWAFVRQQRTARGWLKRGQNSGQGLAVSIWHSDMIEDMWF
jgi:hypothetical protein